MDKVERSERRLYRSVGALVRKIAQQKGLVVVSAGAAGSNGDEMLFFLSPQQAAAARDAGLSHDQVVEALCVNAVPREDFERQVESDNPPTVAELARQGMRVAARPGALNEPGPASPMRGADVAKALRPVGVGAR